MKKLVLLLFCLTTLRGSYETNWPRAEEDRCIDTDNPKIVLHHETSRRRYARIPRRPYQRYGSPYPRWYCKKYNLPMKGY